MLWRESLLFDLSSQFFELCFIITNYIDGETEALSVSDWLTVVQGVNPQKPDQQAS